MKMTSLTPAPNSNLAASIVEGTTHMPIHSEVASHKGLSPLVRPESVALTYDLLLANAQQSEANYDESKVPQFELPDLLVTFDGQQIGDTSEWEKIRKPELYRFFEEKVLLGNGIQHLSEVLPLTLFGLWQ